MKQLITTLFFHKRSILKILVFSLVSTAVILIFVLGILSLRGGYRQYNINLENSTKCIYHAHQNVLTHEIQLTIDITTEEVRQQQISLHKTLYNKTLDAHHIAVNLYEKYRYQLSNNKLKELIKTTLSGINIPSEDINFFINTLSGKIIINKGEKAWNSPARINNTIKQKLHSDTINIINNNNHNTFIKIFKPFNWYIGYTENTAISRDIIRKHILKKISDIKLNDSTEIIMLDKSGKCLAHTKTNNESIVFPHTHNNLSQQTIEQIIQHNNSFITATSANNTPILIHSRFLPQLDLIACSYIEINQLKEQLNNQKKLLQQNIITDIAKIFVVLIVTLLLITIFVNYIVRFSKRDLKTFSDFFAAAITKQEPINLDLLVFKEFKQLAVFANQMLQKRKATELQLNIETTYFNHLFEDALEAIAIIDTNKKGIRVNKKFTELFGYTNSDIKNTTIDKLLVHNDYINEADLLNKIVSKRELLAIETKRKNKSGRLIDVSIIGNPIIFNDEVIASVAIYQDLSDKKQQEKNLKEAKCKAEESDYLKSAFLSNISHEIRTPMNHILGFADLISAPNTSNSDRYEYIEQIKKSGHNLLDIINNIVNLSKLEAKQVNINNTDISINRLAISLYKRFSYFKKRTNKDHIAFNLKDTDNNCDYMLYSDNDKIEQILLIILENAFKFTPKGYVELGYYLSTENTICIYVKDSGIGIPIKEQQHVFELFRQGENSNNRRYGGTGLGLTIAARLTKLLNGTIRLESEPNNGTCIYLELPLNRIVEKL